MNDDCILTVSNENKRIACKCYPDKLLNTVFPWDKNIRQSVVNIA